MDFLSQRVYIIKAAASLSEIIGWFLVILNTLVFVELKFDAIICILRLILEDLVTSQDYYGLDLQIWLISCFLVLNFPIFISSFLQELGHNLFPRLSCWKHQCMWTTVDIAIMIKFTRSLWEPHYSTWCCYANFREANIQRPWCKSAPLLLSPRCGVSN